MYKPKILVKSFENTPAIWDINGNSVNFSLIDNTIKSKIVDRKQSTRLSLDRSYLKEDTSEVSFGLTWGLSINGSEAGIKFSGLEDYTLYITGINNKYFLFHKKNESIPIDLFPVDYGMILWFKCNLVDSTISLSSDFGQNYAVIETCQDVNHISIYLKACYEESFVSYLGLKENNE